MRTSFNKELQTRGLPPLLGRTQVLEGDRAQVRTYILHHAGGTSLVLHAFDYYAYTCAARVSSSCLCLLPLVHFFFFSFTARLPALL